MSDVTRHDVIVVGAGPGGLAAAWSAASRGARVALLDDNAVPGGQIWRAGDESVLPPAAGRRLDQLRGTSCEILMEHAVVARPKPGTLLVETPAGARLLDYDRLVLAPGARELFLPFPGWTLPGVYGIGGLQALVKSGLPVARRHIVVAGSGPLLLAVADQLRRRGAEILCIAEQTSAWRAYRFGINLLSRPAKLIQAMRLRAGLVHVPYDFGWFPVRAEGDERVSSVTLTDGRRERTLTCDMLACGFGMVPNVELPLLLGCELEQGFVRVNEHMETSVPGVYCVGEATMIAGAEAATTGGLIAGRVAAGARPSRLHLFTIRRWRRFAGRLDQAFALRGHMRGEVGEDTPVCRCEDVTLRRLRKHASWRDAKLQTRIGMGPCQGRVCGAACRYLFGWQGDAVRPPLLPVRAETLIDHNGP